jgi:hypothetical protein
MAWAKINLIPAAQKKQGMEQEWQCLLPIG